MAWFCTCLCFAFMIAFSICSTRASYKGGACWRNSKAELVSIDKLRHTMIIATLTQDIVIKQTDLTTTPQWSSDLHQTCSTTTIASLEKYSITIKQC